MTELTSSAATQHSKQSRPSSEKKRNRLSVGDLWQRLGRISIYATAFLLPWFFLPFTLSPVETGKLALIALLGAVGLIAFLAETIERRVLHYPSSWLALGVLGIVGTTALSTLLSTSRSLSLFGLLVQADTLMVIMLGALFFFITSVFIRKSHIGVLIKSFLGGVGLLSILSLVSLLGFSLLPFSFSGAGFVAAGSISALSYLIVGALGLTALLNWEKLSSSHKGGLGIAVAIWVATLFLLNFQEAWLGLAFVALLSAAIGFMRNQQIRLSLLLSIIALCLTLVGPWIPSFVTPQLEIRPDIGSTLEPARQVLTSKRALVGTGPGTFGYAFAQHRSDTLNITDFWNVGFSQGSSFALTALTTLGVLGVLAWLFLYVAFFKRIRTHMGDPIVAGAALFAAFTGIALLVYVGFFVQLIFGAIALGIMSSLTGARKEISFKSNASWRLLIGFLALVIASAVTLAGAYFLGQKYIAAAYTGSGVRALSAGESDRAIEQLNIANRLDTSDISLRFISQALMTKFQELVASASSEDDGQQAQSLISLAVETATNATTINPADSANWSNLASIYESLTPLVEGTGDLALDAYSEAEKRDPQGPQWALAKARTLGAQASFLERNEEEVGDIYERAQTEIERALTLKQNYTAARFLSAQLSFRSGNVDRAIERAAEIRQQNPFDPGVALQIGLLYYQNDQLAEARTEFLRAISLDANFANARYFLGLTESRLGDNDKALSEFRWIAERNPDNEEVKKIIANLENGRAPLEGVAQPLESSETPVPEESQ